MAGHVLLHIQYNDEEDLYIHPQGPFRKQTKKKHHTALTRLEHAQTVGEMNTGHTHEWKMDVFNSTIGSAEFFSLTDLFFFLFQKTCTELVREHLFEIVYLFIFFTFFF